MKDDQFQPPAPERANVIGILGGQLLFGPGFRLLERTDYE